MPKTPAWSPKPAIEKLPLAVRKDIRDNFDSKKEALQERIKTALGSEYTISVKPGEVWAYAEDGNTSAGSCFNGYFEGFVTGLESFLKTYGDNGKQYFNDAVKQSEITLEVNPNGDKGETISADVKDGVYRILFRHDRLGYNQNWQESTILPAVEGVETAGFSLSAKHSIDDKYDEEIDECKEAISKILGAEFTLDPNFEEVYKALSTGITDSKDWESGFGGIVLRYFQGLQYQLERQGFKDDDMLQEGLQETIESKTFRIRVLPKTNSTTETVIEDGVVYLQTRPDRWGYNTNDMGEGLVNLL
ncbi:unnamed protein product [Mycena citricolor]|uniref:Uncharacterized protein n=1 Tax=Mycena citricolor TaxID=2018698 RepID=A0AAD2HXW3_9AGAR|nr:unnamed protein product [Mycena citricolor]